MLTPYLLDVHLCAAVRPPQQQLNHLRIMAVQPFDYACVIWHMDGTPTHVWLEVVAVLQDGNGREYIDGITNDRFGSQDVNNGLHVAFRHANICDVKFSNEVPNA